MPGCRICLIEDDESMGGALALRLELEGFDCHWQKTGRAALAALKHGNYDLVISDILLSDLSGEAIYTTLLEQGQELPPFIFMTGHATVDQAVRLMKRGAVDYLTKPFDPEVLLAKLRELAACRERNASTDSLGISPAMRAVEDLIARLAQSDASVLITGESGVGKEVVARRLHGLRHSELQRPFVAVNCGALPETLLEAELFGHEKGAFTGANRVKRGLLELAEGGTLFLDEIGDMPITMQVKLLRALQERQIRRLGSETAIPVHFRLMVATHQDLKARIETGQFREDLYYRIHVIQVRVPPLRERREDILWLAGRFLNGAADPDGRSCLLSPAAERALLECPWPGNVRELKHVIERARVLANGPMLTPDLLFGEPSPSRDGAPNTPLGDWLANQERNYILSVLAAQNWRVQDTAKLLGISRKNLWEKMKKLEITREIAEAAGGPGRTGNA
jgi:DNA-binding NtrC family response regulator